MWTTRIINPQLGTMTYYSKNAPVYDASERRLLFISCTLDEAKVVGFNSKGDPGEETLVILANDDRVEMSKSRNQ
jgi:hypothetical protein